MTRSWIFALAALGGCGGGGGDGGADARPAADGGSEGADAARGWATWTRFPERHFRGQIFEGDLALASDPTVIRDGDVLRMFYTCVTGAAEGGLCEVTSPDGITWQPVPSIVAGIEGVVLAARAGAWDENLETASAVREGSELRLYYSGYRNLDGSGDRPPAALGVAASTDGVTFARIAEEPVLEPTPGGADGDDLFSAVVFPDGALLRAVYVGWCVPGYHDGVDCEDEPAIQLLGATRGAGGQWTKEAAPVLAPRADVPAMRYGVAEPAILEGPDGQWYLFFTGGLGDTEPRVTAIARGPGPFGPWEIAEAPIVTPEEGFEHCGTFAPSVLLEGDRVRMWYLAIDDCAGACPSCDFAACGCDTTFSIGYAEAAWPLFVP